MIFLFLFFVLLFSNIIHLGSLDLNTTDYRVYGERGLVTDCTLINKSLSEFYDNTNNFDRNKKELYNLINTFNNSRINESTCFEYMGYYYSPCRSAYSCFVDCKISPMCNSLAYNDYFLNYSLFLYDKIIKTNDTINTIYEKLNIATSNQDLINLLSYYNDLYNSTKDYASSPILDNGPTTLRFCPNASYNWSALDKSRELIKNINFIKANNKREVYERICGSNQIFKNESNMSLLKEDYYSLLLAYPPIINLDYYWEKYNKGDIEKTDYNTLIYYYNSSLLLYNCSLSKKIYFNESIGLGEVVEKYNECVNYKKQNEEKTEFPLLLIFLFIFFSSILVYYLIKE